MKHHSFAYTWSDVFLLEVKTMDPEIYFDDEVRTAIIQGVDKLCKSVKTTLGPCGRHVLLQREYKPPLITNDGVTIAKYVHLQDPCEHMGVEVLRETANKTNEEAGDGTTTSIILATHILNRGMQLMRQHANPSLIVKGMDIALSKILDILDMNSKGIKDYKDIAHIATISSKSEEIGEKIAEALSMVEQYSYVHVETSSTSQTQVLLREGMQIDCKPTSFYFFANKTTIIHHRASLLISNQRIETLPQLEHILSMYFLNAKPLIIICQEMSEEVLSTILLSNLKNNSNIYVYQAPSFGDYRNDLLDDIALLSEGVFQQDQLNMDIMNMQIEDLGQVDKIILSKEGIRIFQKKTDEVQLRIAYLKEILPSVKQPYDKKHITKRIMNLEGKLASIEVGGHTQNEIEEKKLRIEDALQATKAAQEEGITWGGGLAYIEAYRQLRPILHDVNRDVEYGIQIVMEALLQPFTQLCENAYLNSEQMLQQQLAQDLPLGYDVQQAQWVHMENTGIMDPVKVLKQALVNACSIASLLIRCDVGILTKK